MFARFAEESNPGIASCSRGVEGVLGAYRAGLVAEGTLRLALCEASMVKLRPCRGCSFCESGCAGSLCYVKRYFSCLKCCFCGSTALNSVGID